MCDWLVVRLYHPVVSECITPLLPRNSDSRCSPVLWSPSFLYLRKLSAIEIEMPPIYGNISIAIGSTNEEA